MKGILLAGLIVLALAGCGGGGGGSSEPVQTGPSAAAGTYQGTSDDGRLDIGVIILQSGEFFTIYNCGDSACIGFLHGHGATTASTFNGSGTDYGIDGDRHTFSLSSTYRSGLSLSGNVGEDGQTTGFTTTYTAEQPLPPASLAGTYTGSYLNQTGAGTATVTIGADGSINTVDQNPCHSSGTATQASGVTGVYEMALTYENNPTNCGAEFAGQTISGIAFIDDDSGSLYALLVSGNGAIAVIYEGHK